MVSAWLDVFAASCGMHPAKKARIEMLPCLFYVMPQNHPARVLRLACTPLCTDDVLEAASYRSFQWLMRAFSYAALHLRRAVDD
jgi:hypothetical protein